MISSGAAEPASARIWITVIGTSWSIDILTATNMHISLLATALRPFSSSSIFIAWRLKTVALFPAPKMLAVNPISIIISVSSFFSSGKRRLISLLLFSASA